MYLKHPIIGPLRMEADDTVIVTSDLHLNHDRDFIYGALGFKNKNEYSQYLIGQLSAVAHKFKREGKKLYLINLGDTAFNDKEGKWFKILNSMPFTRIFMIAGNHTSGIHVLNQCNNITLMGSNIEFVLKKNKAVILSHFPLSDWSGNALGVLCGHCHGNSDPLNPGRNGSGRILDCGVNNAHKHVKRPYFFLTECLKLMLEKKREGIFTLHTTPEYTEHEARKIRNL